ncbi:mRNA triphosphatase CET1 [Acaromyces ingoldii]|uniref:mRNA-capping enzyme subunit beta n=1 Tax=Acaromyces ingoldii TaxID=215250 RepID=A0A316YEZ8_9BASI|nr:mRNA triphosphatase CET1 [Acaromyces ingoldii]PWN87772.1 mRNA triphosphatase CET1 [Acaromyces ingoldii]
MSWPQPPLDRSIVGWDPLDEISVKVGEWIAELGRDRENLEIEAKVGRIVERDGSRVQLPVMSETIVQMQPGWRFESTMSESQHRSINNFLNRAVEDRKRGIKYERQNEIDYFYRQEGGASVRVTRDAGTMQVKEGGIVIKRRIADLNVICPNHDLDYRISINVEQPMSELPVGEPDRHREKNRLHYTHQRLCIDLTQVHMPDNPKQPSNELELEFRDATQLLRDALESGPAAAKNEWTPYYDQILIMLNNVRILIRNSVH